MHPLTKKIYVFFQKNIHTLSYNDTRFFVFPLSNSENHEYMKYFWNIYCFVTIGYFTVMDGSEADGDLVLIQTFLLYYENQFILMLTSIFQGQFP